MNMNEPLADAWSRTKRKYKQTTYYGQNLKANNKHLVDTPTQPLNVKQKKEKQTRKSNMEPENHRGKSNTFAVLSFDLLYQISIF